MYQVANFVRNSRFYNEILDSRRIEKGVGEVDKKPVTRGCCSMVLLLTAWQVPTQNATFSKLLFIPTLADLVIFRTKTTRPSLDSN